MKWIMILLAGHSRRSGSCSLRLMRTKSGSRLKIRLANNGGNNEKDKFFMLHITAPNFI